MEWITQNYSLVIAIIGVAVYFFLSGKKSVSNYLLYAVSLAETELGGGTGRLKLAQVYSDFVAKYPILSKIIPFAVFSAWVDAALDEMRHLIRTNGKIKAAIVGEE